MGDLVLTTFDWVPEPPRGFVRDLRVRWALEEAGLAYRVATTPFEGREAVHFAQQPFGQVPWLTDGDITVFESGAILLYLGEKSAALMPTDPRGRGRWSGCSQRSTRSKWRACPGRCSASWAFQAVRPRPGSWMAS